MTCARRTLGAVAVAALVALAAACATTESGTTEEPAALAEFSTSARVEQVWSASLGGGAPRLRLGLSLAAAGDALFAANRAGTVFAFNPATGKRLWSTSTKVRLSGGPGAGEGLVVVGSGEGDVIALDAATGAIRWKSSINSEVLAAPAIGRQMVVVRTVDGRLVGFRASDGTRAWTVEERPPALTLRGIARPSITGDLVLSGFDNGRLQALQLADGSSRWNINVAPPAGSTELERLNDIDTQPVIRGNDVYVVNFQGKVSRIDLETGREQWSQEQSSYSGLTLDDADGLYITGSDGTVVKLATRNGAEAWSSRVLRLRRLSPPAVLGTLVATADFEGYVHFFDRATGQLAARVKPFSGRVTADPLVIGDTLYMLDVTGRLVALRATPTAAGAGSTTSTGEQILENNSGLRPR